MNAETLGKRLRQAREFNRYTQKQVEEITGIPNTSLSKYEKDQSSPNLIALRQLADCYNVSTDWFFGITSKPNRILPEELKAYDVKWVEVVGKCKKAGLTPEQIEQLIDVVKNLK